MTRSTLRNRLIGVSIGLAVAACLLLVRFAARLPVPFALLPEDAGRIRTVAVQYTHESAPDTSPALASFFRQIASDVEVIAICGSRDDQAQFGAFVMRQRLPNPLRFHTVVVGAPITGWCKDRFLVTQTSPVLLAHPIPDVITFPGRANDTLVAPALARAHPGRFKAAEAPMHFDSGDILATGNDVIVSDELGKKNGGRAAVTGTLQRQFGRRIVWLTGVPPHHIGMFAAPLGDSAVMVGDPSLVKSLSPPKVDGLTPDFSRGKQALFDSAANQLRQSGFRVIRLPELYLGPKTYITYTNAVFDTYGHTKVVYMPWYDIPALDQAARQVYRHEGWTVRPIPVRTLYKHRGTIGCLVNVLEREPPS